MINTEQTENRIKIELNSSWKKISEALLVFGKFLSQFESDEWFSVKSRIVLRELLTNAIKHGNLSDTSRMVTVTAEFLSDQKLLITVMDEGYGFDHNRYTPEFLEKQRPTKNRGFFLIHSLSDRIEFNQAGNKVSASLSVSSNGKEWISRNFISDNRNTG